MRGQCRSVWAHPMYSNVNASFSQSYRTLQRLDTLIHQPTLPSWWVVCKRDVCRLEAFENRCRLDLVWGDHYPETPDEELMDIVESIDFAQNLVQVGGVPPLLECIAHQQPRRPRSWVDPIPSLLSYRASTNAA